MPPLQSEEELLDFTMTPVEQLEMSLLLEYLDAHPLKPVPTWEEHLRAMADKPLPPVSGKRRWFSRFAQWFRQTAVRMGVRTRCRRDHRCRCEPSPFVRISREGKSDFSADDWN